MPEASGFPWCAPAHASAHPLRPEVKRARLRGTPSRVGARSIFPAKTSPTLTFISSLSFSLAKPCPSCNRIHPLTTMTLPTPPPTLPHTRANSTDSCFAETPVFGRLSSCLPVIHVYSEVEHKQEASPSTHIDKRRRVNSRSNRPQESDTRPSPSNSQRTSTSPRPARKVPDLAPIKPIGFAASRESRREEGDRNIPSPVVMGFDFQSIDGDQLRTVCQHIPVLVTY